jgi:hypothetical protein
MLLACVGLQACETFGGEPDHPRHEPRYAAEGSSADCERLAPFVANADGSLSKADLENGLKTEFKGWDKNADGQLSQAEAVPLNDHLRSLNVGASPVMDWNGDGHISYEEFASGWRTMFDLCGGEDSGVVTKADMTRSPNVTPPRKTDEEKRPEGASSPNTGGGGY